MAIRDKLVITFFVFIIVPMLLLWARWQGTAVGSIKSVLHQGLSDRAREISDQITLRLLNHQTQVLDLTRQPAMRAYARALAVRSQAVPEGALEIDLSAFLLAHQNKYSALIIVNQAGAPVFKLVVAPGPNGVIRPFSQVRDFPAEDALPSRDILKNTPPSSVSFSEFMQDANGTHIQVIAPLQDEAGGTAGGLVIKLRADELLSEAVGPRIVQQNDQADAARTDNVIVSPQGVVLYATDQTKQGKSYTESFRELGPAISSIIHQNDQDHDLQPWLIRHRLRESSPKLSILVLKNYNQAINSLEYDSYILLLLTLLLVVVAMLLLYALISGITDSIRRVTIGAKAIASGNLGYQIKVKSKDETRVLAEAFNRMAGRLREMIKKEGEQKQFESFARLSAVLTHDLKNQILSLSLLVSNMERKFDREGFKEDAMRTLSDSVNNLQNLVSKLSDPRTPTKRIRERANLTTLAERVIQRTAGQATNRYRISAQLNPDLHAVIDGKAIERVIENLVINALEAMPEGGSLHVTTRQDDGHAIISVADTGKGMTEEFIRERLFHPFATTKKKGIGLGLYSCRDIIEQHGGRIDVASQIDAGTEFRIVLPLKVEDPSIAEPDTATV